MIWYFYAEACSVLEVGETIPLNICGQGIARDRSDRGVLYDIVRATDEEEEVGLTNRVIVFASNVRKQDRMDDDEHRGSHKGRHH